MTILRSLALLLLVGCAADATSSVARIAPDHASLRLPGEEVIVDTAPLDGAAAAEQTDPAIAAGNGGFALAWADARSGAPQIVGRLMSSDGTLGAGHGVELGPCTGDSDCGAPAIASDGTGFLVVWHHRGTGNARHLVGRRFTATLAPIDAEPFAIGAASGSQYDPAVAWDGSRYLVVWSDTRGGANRIRAARVTPEGVVSGDVLLSAGPARQTSPAVASARGSSLVVWADARAHGVIYGVPIANDAELPAGDAVVVGSAAEASSAPTLAAGDDGYLLAWQTENGDVGGAHIGDDGAPGVSFAIATGDAVQHEPAVTWVADAHIYVVAWSEASDGQRGTWRTVTSAGVLGTPLPAVTSGDGVHGVEAIASTGAGAMIVLHSNERGAELDVSAAALGEALDTGDDEIVLVSTGANEQRDPAVVFSHGGGFLVWRDGRHGVMRPYGVHLLGDGTLDPVGPIPLDDEVQGTTSIDVAGDGDGYLVAYTAEGGCVVVQRVGPDGVAVGGHEVLTEGGSRDVQVAGGSDSFLVVWQTEEDTLQGALVTAAGHGDLQLITDVDQPSAPSVDATGSGYVVAWERHRPPATTGIDVFAAQITPSPWQVHTPLTLETGTGDQIDPSIRGLTAASRDLTSNLIRIARSDEGVVSGFEIPVPDADEPVLLDGYEWTELVVTAQDGARWLRLFPETMVLESNTLIAPGARAVSATRTGLRSAVAYERYDDAPLVAAPRVRIRIAVGGILGDACDVDNPCDESECINDVCQLRDAGVDAAPDAGTDAAPDAAPDAATDAVDAAPDAATDVRRPDAGTGEDFDLYSCSTGRSPSPAILVFAAALLALRRRR